MFLIMCYAYSIEGFSASAFVLEAQILNLRKGNTRV